MDFSGDYCIYESSDEGSYESDTSDDELKSFIREEYGIKKQDKKYDKKDFENEMEQELNEQIKLIENEMKQDFKKETNSEGDTTLNKSLAARVTVGGEDSVMSESSKECNKKVDHCSLSAEISEAKLGKKKCTPTEKMKSDPAAPTNDDLLYDPEMDDDDQKWIDEQRRSYIFPGSKTDQKHKLKPLPNSDAVLNCPACLSVLCLDCQRHEIYKSQYRAMFVKNCTVDTTQKLYYGEKKKSKKVPRKKTECVYHPVKCAVCQTSVAVYDEEEVYHFFNVVSSFT